VHRLISDHANVKFITRDANLAVVRSLFLFLSRRKLLRRWMETSSLARRLATRFIAGETLEQAIAVARKLKTEGITVTLDHLGESVTNLDEAASARDIYLRALDALHTEGLEANVSLKLTQFGLDLSADQCLANVDQLVKRAAELGGFVRVDMESSEYTQRTLDLVAELFKRHGAVGTVIQAYLYRSRGDIELLNGLRIRVRLCKGAYLELEKIGNSIGFPAYEQVVAEASRFWILDEMGVRQLKGREEMAKLLEQVSPRMSRATAVNG